MKRLMLWEMAVLAILLIATVVVLVTFPNPKISLSAADDPDPSEKPQPTEPLFIPTWNTYPDDRQLLAQQYFVYDTKENKFLIASGQENTKVYPASITKLFTAYVAMQHLQPTDKITAGDALGYVVAGSSVAKIKRGDVLTAEQLVEAMLLPSGNDAAYILACAAGRVIKNDPNLSAGTACRAFMDEMNAQAAALGMTGTKFQNPDGIHDPNHYSTFADLAILGKLSLSNETVIKYATTARDSITLHGETLQWKNTNKLVDPRHSYYCPHALGLKTGQTPDAGSCLLSAFRYEGKELIIGVFGCPEEEDRFDDTLQLFNQIVLK